MRLLRFIFIPTVMVGFVGGPGVKTASAQTSAQAIQQQIEQLRRDFDALKQQYGDRLTALEASLATIQGGQGGAATAPATAPATVQVPPGAEGAGGPSGALPVYGNAAASSKVFNPDMAVIGDFLGAAGKNTVNPCSGAGDARVGGDVPGDPRSVRARRLLHRVRRRRRGARRRIRHLHVASRPGCSGKWASCARHSAR